MLTTFSQFFTARDDSYLVGNRALCDIAGATAFGSLAYGMSEGGRLFTIAAVAGGALASHLTWSAVEASRGEGALFLKKFFASPNIIGAIAPSSQAVAREMARFVRSTEGQNGRYLEIGAGTGAFTGQLVDKLLPGDTLDIVEFDLEFCALLDRRFANDDRVRIHCADICSWQPPEGQRYDAVISALPLTAFTPEKVESVLLRYRELVKQEGTLSYIEYIGLPAIKRMVLPAEQRERFDRILHDKQHFVDRWADPEATKEIYGNLPPARIIHCRGRWTEQGE